VALRVLNAADFGAPQARERAFLIGFRDSSDFKFPTPTHARSDQASLLGLQEWRTAWDALADLEDPDHEHELRMRGKWAELLPSRSKLPVAYATRRRHASVRLAHPLLVLLVETFQAPPMVDDSSAIRPGDRPVPLEKSKTFGPRDGAPAIVPGRLVLQLASHQRCAATNRQRGPELTRRNNRSRNRCRAWSERGDVNKALANRVRSAASRRAHEEGAQSIPVFGLRS